MPRFTQTIQFRPDRPPVKPEQHGTTTAYGYGCKCGDCREAHAAYRLELYYRRKNMRRLLLGRWMQADLPPDGPWRHGLYSTYMGWSCRCDPCSDAYSEAIQRYRQTGRLA